MTNVKSQNLYQSVTTSAASLLNAFGTSDKAGDLLLRILGEAMDSEETESWTVLQKSEMVDICRILIKLIHNAENLIHAKSEPALDEFKETVRNIFETYESAKNVYEVLLNVLAVSMSAQGCGDIWDKHDRAEAVHLIRYSINLLNAVEAYAAAEKLGWYYDEVVK